MRTVLGTSMPLDSWARPRETVHWPGSAARNSSAKRNSFQAIMKTYRPVAIREGRASGRITLRTVWSREQPSSAAASSMEAGMVTR